ncbi:helix-turn-helix domain-containing protein [Propioniciclava coleopterorum]|uniref:Helix-turn-helix domain-containing protein n=1 Tax=Propioniciclava coleopterorum TaxID=2714937 RepID=A0A6G7Y8Y9_9ACTN|nr:helix-turn-helix domain-containing protein [Propioniciclava coleopterorum]QIK73275.1 helix-turn-helix domain-containing protein [Propioniciclava coleopterorum]
MPMSVSEAAERLGLSSSRVKQMLVAGDLPGERVGHVWVLNERDVRDAIARWRPRGRPLSQQMAAGLVDLLAQQFGSTEGRAWLALDNRNRSRLRSHLRALRGADHPAALLRALAPNVSERRTFHYTDPLQPLLDDGRLLAGGNLNQAVGMPGGDAYDFHIAAADVAAVIAHHLLVEDPRGNLTLHVQAAPRADLAASLLDLALRGGSRADAVVAERIQA